MTKRRQLELFAKLPNPSFEMFWSKYPRQEAKIPAREAFERVLRLKLIEFDQLLQAIERFARHVSGKDPEKIPLPATWLNAGRWDDVYEAAPVMNGSSWKALRGTHVSKYQ